MTTTTTNTTALAAAFATLLGVYGGQPGTVHARGLPAVGGVEHFAAAAPDEIKLPGEWSLAERSTWKQIYADRMQYVNLMNSTCGTSMTLSFDHEAFRDRLPSVDANRNEDWNASALITEIRNLCLRGDAEKATVAEKLTSIHFVRGPDKKHRIRGKRLVIALDLDANPRQYVNDFAAWLASSL